MGVAINVREENMSRMKRFSQRVAQKIHPKRLSGSKRMPSDLSKTRGNKITEENAVNEEGVKIIDNIAKEMNDWVNAETKKNEDDPFAKDKCPDVTLASYIGRLARYSNIMVGQKGGRETAGIRSAVMCVMYLERLKDRDFAINKNNIHRLIQAGFLASLKFEEDKPVTSEFWARVAGIAKEEVNHLESAFCNLIKFELFVKENDYLNYVDQFDLPDF